MTWPRRDGGDLELEPRRLAVGPGQPGKVLAACRGQRGAQEKTAAGGGGWVWATPGHSATVTARPPLPAVRFLSALQASAGPWEDVAGPARDGLWAVGIRGDPRRFPSAQGSETLGRRLRVARAHRVAFGFPSL